MGERMRLISASFRLLVVGLHAKLLWGWTVSPPATSWRLHSTPFEAGLYDGGKAPEAGDGLVVGVNKYSHDASVCIASAQTGRVLMALSKERLTRVKHDAGNVASLVETCLDQLGGDYTLESIRKVVMNNHHHRILPLECNDRQMEWEAGLRINGGAETGYDDPFNTFLTGHTERHELSHHLAHAYSTATQAPFDSGLCVVMDGMGESFRTMMHYHGVSTDALASSSGSLQSRDSQSRINQSRDRQTYTSDLSFGIDTFQCVPHDIVRRCQSTIYDWREAESVYTFRKLENGSIDLRPIFKRFTPENTPPALFNHGFENMDSVGALYSRASSHIFGDWNACGKVMGLAPWANYSWTISLVETGTAPAKKKNRMVRSSTTAVQTSTIEPTTTTTIQPKLHSSTSHRIMWGKLYVPTSNNHNNYNSNDVLSNLSETFAINRSLLEGLPYIARTDPDLYSLDGTEQRKRYDFDDNDGYEDIIKTQDIHDNHDNRSEQISTEPSLVKQQLRRQLPTRVALDAIALANRIQIDLEDVVLDFVKHFQSTITVTNTSDSMESRIQNNLCLAGGVALNSVLNGRLARELGFEGTFVSPYPGDDGIAVGCCAYGLFGNHFLQQRHQNQLQQLSEFSPNKQSFFPIASPTTGQPRVWRGPLSPYLGPDYSEEQIQSAINDAMPWLDVELVRDDEERLAIMAKEVQRGAVVAWFRSRSELGPRALGHRSILADPRKKGLVRFINQHVKSRESFRPFAPSVLAEHAADWFDLGSSVSSGSRSSSSGTSHVNNVSPYMSMTAFVHSTKKSFIPAVTHVDGSSRLQTVTVHDEPLYHKFITKFFELTGIPMVLNTSFNTLPGEPIVETPKDAIRSFLYAMGSIETLVLGEYILRRKKPNLHKLLGQITNDGVITTTPAYPKRPGSVQFQSVFELSEENSKSDSTDDSNDVHMVTKVRMPSRPLHNSRTNEWVELLDELEGELLAVCDGSVTLNEIFAQYSSVPMSSSLSSSEDDEDDIDNRNTSNDANQTLLQNIVHRLVRLYEETLVGW